MFKKTYLTIFIISLIAVFTGCGTRGPSSSYIGPPVDVTREKWEEDIRRISSGELTLPETDNYLIGPGDELSFSLIGHPEILGLDEEGERYLVTVTQNPSIILPYIGAIRAHGKSPETLQQDVQNAYRSVLRDPVLILTIDNYYYNQVTLLGSVQTPGRYPLLVGDTVLDGIFKANGLTFGGDQNRRSLPPARFIKIFRDKVGQQERLNMPPGELLEFFRDDSGRITPREEIVLPLDEFIFGGDLTYNIPLEPNDVIFIPPAGTVSLHGPFVNPRVVFLGPGLRTVVQVITEAGGLKFKSASRIEVVRRKDDGTVESYFMDSRRMMKRKTEDFILEDNDQMFAYHHPVRSVLGAFGEFFRGTANVGASATYAP